MNAAPKAHAIAKVEASGGPLSATVLWPKRNAGRATKKTPTYDSSAHAKSMRSVGSPSSTSPVNKSNNRQVSVDRPKKTEGYKQQRTRRNVMTGLVKMITTASVSIICETV